MVGPSSQVSKLLVALLILLVTWYLYMDVNLYLRVQNYPIDRDGHGDNNNNTANYEEVSWVGCDVSPLCDVTPKALLLDHTNHYLFAPFVVIVDDLLKISEIRWITPNVISFFHVFVAVLSAKCVSSDSLAYRRMGVGLFELRSILDDMDGHVARVRKNIKGELSEIGTSGYYIDGLCDGLGTVALMIGAFIFLRNNPPRRGYVQLPTTVITDVDRERNLAYKIKVTTGKVIRKVGCFTVQLLVSSSAWNRYIALYQDMLGGTSGSVERQNVILKSSFFFMIAWLWRIVNVHSLMHFMLLAIFCDKLWEFLRTVQYTGFGVLLGAICVTEMHLVDVKKFLYKDPGNATIY